MRRFLSRLISVVRHGRAERDLSREVDAHLRLLEDDFIARGMRAPDARAAARRAFGGVEQTKEHQRDARSFRWLLNSRTDVTLGLRMLRKYPGLAVVSVLGMTVGIAIAAGAFCIVSTVLYPTLPFEAADRIVSLQLWDTAGSRAERRVTRDFPEWVRGLRSFAELAAFRETSRNLIAPAATPETVRVAEMTASGFRIAGVQPLLGRPILDPDERADADPVVVIGYDVWRRRFNRDPAILGSTVTLGEAPHTVVGVMPDGYTFPVNHQVWTPWRPARAYEPRTGPDVFVFGRLANGMSLQAARAEFELISRHAATAPSDAKESLRAQVVPYTYPFTDMDAPGNRRDLALLGSLATSLLLLVSVNVSILVYARTATRQAEIAVRTALGASRRRIVGQLFVEALVLTGIAGAAGLLVASVALRFVQAAVFPSATQLPQWIQFRVSPLLILWTAGLALGAAAIVGMIPALKATGRRVQAGLQGFSPGSGAGMRMGTLWTLLVVAQVACAVALLPMAVYQAWDTMRHGVTDPGFAADRYVTAELAQERDAADGDSEQAKRALDAFYSVRHRDLMDRIEEEAGVVGATFSTSLPGREPAVFVEVEGQPLPPRSAAEATASGVKDGTFGQEARFNRVAVDFFEQYGVTTVTGRTFGAADTQPTSDAIVVNRSFAERLLGGTALGRRVRYVGRSGDAGPEHVQLGRWYEVVGVVADFPAGTLSTKEDATMYHAADFGAADPVHLALRFAGPAPASFAPRLRELAASVNGTLMIRGARRLDDVYQSGQAFYRTLALALGVVTLSVLALSSAGIYAMMSLAVVRRRRDIGIRAALGANPRQLLRSLFTRTALQLTAGAAVGLAIAAGLEYASNGDTMSGHAVVVLPVVALFVVAVGLLATIGPARRGLRIDPTEALRAE